jgi:succinate-semialdehyde dehydrogenase/glutarate-semialdehyde dehydrogenase
LAPVFRFKDEAEVIAMRNNSPPVSRRTYSRDLGRVWRVAEALSPHGRRQHRMITTKRPLRRRPETALAAKAHRHGRMSRSNT